ncbi:Protein of unknown function [Cotesia congregata]|uniref:Endonuclease/exonuclease/phosphatase domain-containing protein n=1 Tax=Cotesia congregata TaxID=51543 RepID=A0A8J2E6U7_COTCN|nr:Protein of unknown function [Cotesia congregata]
MGNFGHLPEEALEYTNFTGKRASLDQVCNHQGKILALFMAENGFILLNGRSPGDSMGDFTFSSPLGNSTVDFIWVDVSGLHLVGDMWVDNRITGSDHFPITISLLLNAPLPVNNVWSEDRQSNITKWRPECADRYRYCMEWSPLVKIDLNEATVEDFNTQLKKGIDSAANDAQMSLKEQSCTFNHSFKSWFDKSCRALNHTLKILLKKCKAAGNDVYLWSEYNRKKKEYYTYLKGKKVHHITTIQDKFACAKNSKDFWEVVETVRKPPYRASKVSLQKWENFFQEVYPPRELYLVVSDVHEHPILDAEITLEELQLSLKKSKSDDIAMLFRSANHLLRGLKILENYCNLNSMQVNISKIKVLRVSSTGKSRRKCPTFLFNEETIEMVNSYTYLGVVFTAGVIGIPTVKYAVNKSKIATGTALTVLAKLKADSWCGKIKIYNGLVNSTLLYLAQIWCLRPDFIETVEAAHLDFFKRLLNLPKCTPGYALRSEMNIPHIATDILQLAINWGIKILKLENHRLPELCLFRLAELRNSSTNQHKCNWAHQLSNLLRTVNEEQLLDNPDADYRSARKNIILRKFRCHLALADRERYSRSSSCQTIFSIPLFEVIPELTLRVPHHLSKPIIQLRLASKYACYLSINSESINLSPLKDCKFCSTGSKETILHVLIQCPLYSDLRK